MTVARLNGYDVGLPDAALDRAFNQRRAAAALVGAAPDCPLSARAFLAALEADVARGVVFDLAGTPSWAHVVIPLHPTLLVPAARFGPPPPVLPQTLVGHLATASRVPVLPDLPAAPALPPPLLRAVASPVRPRSPTPPPSPPYVPQSPSPAPPSPRSTPPPPLSPARQPSPAPPFSPLPPRSLAPALPQPQEPLFLPSPSPVAGPSGTRHSASPPLPPPSPSDVEMHDVESREGSPAAALPAASPPRDPSPPPAPRLTIHLPARPPPFVARRPPPFVTLPDGSRVFTPPSRPTTRASSAPSAPAPTAPAAPIFPITPALGSLRLRDVPPPDFPPLGSKERDRRGHFLYEAVTPCVECAKLRQTQRCRVDGVAGHACVYCALRHRKCSLAAPGTYFPLSPIHALTFFPSQRANTRFALWGDTPSFLAPPPPLPPCHSTPSLAFSSPVLSPSPPTSCTRTAKPPRTPRPLLPPRQYQLLARSVALAPRHSAVVPLAPPPCSLVLGHSPPRRGRLSRRLLGSWPSLAGAPMRTRAGMAVGALTRRRINSPTALSPSPRSSTFPYIGLVFW